jgi:hypothetical protein
VGGGRFAPEAADAVRDALAEGPPEISIIVSTKDRLSALRDCVESLRRDPCRKQVIIQDGASTDAVFNFQSAIFRMTDLRRQGSIHPHINQCECFDITIKMLLSNGVQYWDGDPFTVSEALMRCDLTEIGTRSLATMSPHSALICR